jgi:hypothetical protein
MQVAAVESEHDLSRRRLKHGALGIDVGGISVQAIAGHVRMHLQEELIHLRLGRVLALERAFPPDVEALEHSAFLLTIAWMEAGPKN